MEVQHRCIKWMRIQLIASVLSEYKAENLQLSARKRFLSGRAGAASVERRQAGLNGQMWLQTHLWQMEICERLQ